MPYAEEYASMSAPCGQCGGVLMCVGGAWTCSYCGIPCDYATGKSGVSHGNPVDEKRRVITLNGGTNTQDMNTERRGEATLAQLIEAEHAEEEAEREAKIAQAQMLNVAAADAVAAAQPVDVGVPIVAVRPTSDDLAANVPVLVDKPVPAQPRHGGKRR